MIQAERAERRDLIRKLYSEGVPASELAERFGLTQTYIYIISKGARCPSSAAIDTLRENAEDVISLLEAGAAYREVCESFDVPLSAVRGFCKEYDVQHLNAITEAEAARRIKDKSNGLLEYVSGYTVKQKPVRVRCVVCGGEFERTYHNITTKGGVSCPYCKESERAERKKKETSEKERRRVEREHKASERKAERLRRSEAWKNRPIRECVVCGTLTQNPKYCSAECRNKANNSTHEHRRRALIKSLIVDKDITLEGLFKRDDGVCAICGERCNFEDYTVKSGTFIAGDWYPSIDHIKPISRGGAHSWDNVQLAHRRCNTLKRDKEQREYLPPKK